MHKYGAIAINFKPTTVYKREFLRTAARKNRQLKSTRNEVGSDWTRMFKCSVKLATQN